MTGEELIKLAKEAATYSYSPYSNYKVGAALLASSGIVYTGCNIENAAYSVTNCAERTALFKAISVGETSFEAIAVVGGQNGNFDGLCTPCGVCRQAFSEFCNMNKFKVYLCENGLVRTFSLNSLLPYGFKLNTMGDTE